MKYILFIDDCADRIKTIEWDSNWIVIPACGFEQLNHWFTQKTVKFDLIMCDHDMPDTNGVDVCNYWLIARNTPVVIHSGNPDAARRMDAILTEYDVPHVTCSIINPDRVEAVLRENPWLS